MIDRWPLRHGTALGIAVLVLLTMIVAVIMQAAADRALPMGYAPAGEYSFADHCGSCHGFYAEGTEAGPSLIEARSATPVDSDAIKQSVRKGVGAMPAMEALEDQDLADIIAFVRDLQTEPGF
jgi:mono/diheme cytochrome c family protein